jgi:hypothetical protein
MIGIETKILTGQQIRLEMMACQADLINRRSVNCPKLTAVLEYCIPRQYLERVTIHGMRGNESHATLEIKIDRVSNDVHVALHGQSVPERYAIGPGGQTGDAVPPDLKERSECPVWRKAVDFFVRLCGQKGLQLWWTIILREKRDEVCKKFGLGPATFVDRTTGAAAQAVPNSIFTELTLTAAFSVELWPDEKRGRR